MFFLRRTNAESDCTMSVSICGGINGEDKGFGACLFGSCEYLLGDGIIGGEVNLCKLMSLCHQRATFRAIPVEM